MKSPIAFLQVALHEMGSWCHTSTSQDLKTILARFEHEGMSFLTISLPSFGKDFQKSLDQGYVDRNLFTGFQWKGGLPRLLGGFLDRVFDRSSGVLLDEPDVLAIRCIHQITQMFAKIKLPCSDAREAVAFDKYVECEQEVRDADARLSDEDKILFAHAGRILWSELFSAVDQKVYDGGILPRHGPGSTADKLRGNSKYQQAEWTERLEGVFPAGEFVIPNWRYYQVLQDLTFLEPGAERPVRVVSVPKTLKTPRIIALEPTCMQYVQQGLLEAIVEGIEGNDTLRSLISWSSQTPNQELARLGSRLGTLATLDLSEASDRVSNQHVRLLLSRFPHFGEAVDACRSRKADVPGHGVIRLAKFASMGSALCFPFEAIVFTTVIFMAIAKALNTPLTTKIVKSFVGKVRVYGDDIIVPVEFVNPVVDALTAFGLKVNVNKSFWTGRFRESCGGDFYDGHDISIVRVRSEFPTQRKHVAEIISTVALRNQLLLAGFSETVEWLDGVIMRVLPHFPIIGPDSPALGRLSLDGIYSVERHCRHLQRPLVKAYVVTSELPKSKIGDHYALTKWFLKRGQLPFADPNHLLRAGRPVSVDIKTRWVSPV